MDVTSVGWTRVVGLLLLAECAGFNSIQLVVEDGIGNRVSPSASIPRIQSASLQLIARQNCNRNRSHRDHIIESSSHRWQIE